MSHDSPKFTMALLGLLALGFFVWAGMNLEAPLTGNHRWRQADTVSTGLFFCQEDASLLKPKVAMRNGTSGIAIGEFPLFSWVVSIPCQVTGQWPEWFPRVLSLTFLLITSLLFATASARPITAWEKCVRGSLLFFGVIYLEYVGRPFPDSMALMLIMGGFWIFQKKLWTIKEKPWFLLATVLVTLGFLIRPYLAPLLIIFVPGFRWKVITLIPVVASYWFWYHHWVETSEIVYYNVNPKGLTEGWAEIFKDLPRSMKFVGKQFVQLHTNWIMAPIAALGFIKRPFLFVLFLFSLVLVMNVSGDHFIVHPYYMFSGAVIATLSTVIVLRYMPVKLQKVLIVLYAVAGVVGAQHMFRKPKLELWKQIPQKMQALGIPEGPITVLNEGGGELFYYAKRVGWRRDLNAAAKEDPCLGNSVAAMWVEGERLTVVKCGEE